MARNMYIQALRQPNMGGSARDLGFVVPTAPPWTIEAQRVELARVRVPPEYARDWTVVLGAPKRQYAPARSTEIADAIAEVKWGHGGVFNVAHIDWAQGAQFSVFGSEVQVVLDHPGAQVDTQEGTDFDVAAFIAPGTAHPNSVLTRTVSYGTIENTLTVTQYVPRFAREVNIYSNVTTNQMLATLQFFNNFGTRLARWQYANLANRCVLSWDGTPIPVPNQATRLDIQNTQGNAGLFFAQYRLAI